GMPRVQWWNWTESGWHALAAIDYPIEFSPTLGAIVFVHADSASKRMHTLEFRISWFRMLSEVREAAARARAGESWWAQEMLPLAYRRFLASLVRFCSRDGSQMYETLAALGVASGLNAHGVSGSVSMARLAARLGIGEPINAALDAALRLRGRMA